MIGRRCSCATRGRRLDPGLVSIFVRRGVGITIGVCLVVIPSLLGSKSKREPTGQINPPSLVNHTATIGWATIVCFAFLLAVDLSQFHRSADERRSVSASGGTQPPATAEETMSLVVEMVTYKATPADEARCADPESVEGLLWKIAKVSSGTSSLNILVPHQLTFRGRPVRQDAAMAVVTDRLLAKKYWPSGSTATPGGRVYRYDVKQ